MIIQEAILQLNPSIVKLIDRVGYDANDNVVEYDMDAAQALMDSKAYQDKRATAYPSIQEQLDMQYWDSVNGTTTWKDAIEAVKTENPKP
jgi:ABC-type enterochelin transport system substrate-binding protein